MLKFKFEKMRTSEGIVSFLHILRLNGWTQQFCPYPSAEIKKDAMCGEWCPQFGEVATEAITVDGQTKILGYRLELCHGKVIRGEFVSK